MIGSLLVVENEKQGINVEFLGIKQIKLPESVTQLVFNRMEAERKTNENAITFEGVRLAENIKSGARTQSARMLTEADAEATRQRALGWQKASDSFEIFRTDPKFADLPSDLERNEAAGPVVGPAASADHRVDNGPMASEQPSTRRTGRRPRVVARTRLGSPSS